MGHITLSLHSDMYLFNRNVREPLLNIPWINI